MRADFDKLRQVLQPTTEEEIRASLAAFEAAPDEPGFVSTAEHEMRDDFLTCAHSVARKEATKEALRMASL
jgi:hypothetical protein